MYTNEDLHTLINEARAGGKVEHGRLLGAVYDVLQRCIKSDQSKIARAVATYNSVDDSVGSVFVEVTDNVIKKFGKGKGNSPLTYIVQGWNYACLRDCDKRTRGNYQREKHMNAYRGHLNRNNDPFEQAEATEADSMTTGLMHKAVKTLPLNQQDAIEGYMKGEPCHLTCKSMGVTAQRTHQLRRQGLATLKEILKHKLN